MTEYEYIAVQNRVRISAALQHVRDIYNGKNYGLNEQNLRTVTRGLVELEMEAFAAVPDLSESG